MFAKDTLIHIWSGLDIPVQDIEIGQILIGDKHILDSYENREVLYLYGCNTNLYRFYLWSRYTVDLTEDHILCLMDNSYAIHEIPVREYLTYDQDTRNRYAMYSIDSSGISINCILKVESLGIQECYGFTLDGNHRFLNWDRIVLHD